MPERELQEMLKASSLHTLLMLTQKALTRSGFGDVQILDRRLNAQKTRFGGHELMCETTTGFLKTKVIVKVINDSVRVRMLDEMVGCMNRVKADFGLVVTPHNLSPKAAREQVKYSGSRFAIIDGEKLVRLLTRHKIGVRGATNEVDYAFFEHLQDFSERLLFFITNPNLHDA